jgi:hypothetical protein
MTIRISPDPPRQRWSAATMSTVAAVASDYANGFAPEPSWRLGYALRHVNSAIAAL